MKNPIVSKFLDNGMMEINGNVIEPSWELSEKIFSALKDNNMKVQYSFSKEDGTLIFEKVLGRDANNDFYNESNNNLENRKAAIKNVIVSVLLSEYNK